MQVNDLVQRSGFWEPHSSSVDFCEVNYLLSHHIAEFHNTWSSLAITGIALVGLLYSNPLRELRYSVMFGILGMVGIGSALLHSTLHWLPQSSDEIPMLWQSLSFFYSLLVMNDPPESTRPVWLGFGFLGLGILQTFLYYRFQQTYTIFIASFMAYSLINALWTAHLAFSSSDATGELPNTARDTRISLWCRSFFCFAVLGGGIWAIDFHGCSALQPYYLSMPSLLKGITFHVLWHFASSFGVYLATVFLVFVRLQSLRKAPELVWLGGLVPVCRLHGAAATAAAGSATLTLSRKRIQ